MIETATRRGTACRRPRVSTCLSRVLDLGDGWELLAGRDGRPYLRGPDFRPREVGLQPEPLPAWLVAVAEKLAEEGLFVEVREALEHVRLRWGG